MEKKLVLELVLGVWGLNKSVLCHFQPRAELAFSQNTAEVDQVRNQVFNTELGP